MFVKRFNPLEDPPTASSSDDDEEFETSIGEGDAIEGNSSSEEEEEDDESPINHAVIKHETSLSAATEKNQISESESGSEEGTDSDSVTERRNQVKIPTPSVAKSAAETKKGEPSVKSATRKRPMGTDDAAASTDTKRVKRFSPEDERKSVVGVEETKKTYFQRVWSEEDEIALLQGIIDYKASTGVSPYDDTNGFYQLVKKSISFDVSKIQFMEKLRGLKKKFENNVGRGKNGEEPILSKSHDRKAFDLSKTIWGVNGILIESAVKSNGKSKKSMKLESVKQEPVSSLPIAKNCEGEVAIKGEVSSNVELDTFMKSVLVKSLSRFGVDDLSVEQGWSRLSSEDKKRFEEQWNVLQLKEFEFYSQKSGFIHEVVTKMAEVFRPSP